MGYLSGREGLAFFDYVVPSGGPVVFRVDMTPAGPIEIPLLLLQLGTGMLATWAGIRIVDDIKMWKARRVTVKEKRR